MTCRVKILFSAMFREIAGRKEVVKEIDSNWTLGDLLQNLAEEYGKDFKTIIDSERGEIGSETIVAVNGRNVRKTDIKLQDNDIVMITVPVGGG
ncbi:MAG: MoaD/ThiS family protein [Candidatus Bathyarchaeia archaeon]